MNNELERLRKENAELRAELAKYKRSHAKGANARSVARGVRLARDLLPPVLAPAFILS